MSYPRPKLLYRCLGPVPGCFLAAAGILRRIRIEPESFALRQDSAQETLFPFAKVLDVRKQGRGSRKALWIPLAIGGGVLVALCVAPYPIGFLCRSDPS